LELAIASFLETDFLIGALQLWCRIYWKSNQEKDSFGVKWQLWFTSAYSSICFFRVPFSKIMGWWAVKLSISTLTLFLGESVTISAKLDTALYFTC
jgi:hypothetical protein